MRERILVLAPRGRDAEVIQSVLQKNGTATDVFADLSGLRKALDGEAGGVILTEEALSGPSVESLLEWCEQQPAWSDLPFTVLATKQLGHRSRESMSVITRMGNVVVLERPINAETLSSAVKSALRARWRQYEARGLLADQDRAAAQLLELNESLEQRVEERTEELANAQERLEFAMTSAGMGSWELDLRSNTSTRSTIHDQIFGYDTPQVDWGSDFLIDHVVEDERQSVSDAFAEAIVNGVINIECRIRRADGEVRYIIAKGEVEYGRDGEPLRMAGVIMDTTDKRLTEDSLHQAQKMEAIGQLTGGVAHDFNNLLTVIVGGLDMLIRKPDQPARVLRLAEAAMTAARRGERLTQQLLAFSRRQMLRPEIINPNRLIIDFEALAKRAVGDAISLKFDLDPGVNPIRVDPIQLESAILNLIVNARDAMSGSGSIVVNSRNVHRATTEVAGKGMMPGSYVEISVKDNGEGIDSETLGRVFEPFFTTKEVGKGSGLGLAQVYGFVRSAGGDATIDSEVGAGTTVRLFFPRSVESPSDAQPVVSNKVPLRRAANGETVLLVEDDEQVLAMAIESLEELQYQVIVSHDAKEALRHLEGDARIDIMFSDVVMPGGMNGAQLAVEARRLRPELKVLLTSGYVGQTGADQVINQDLPVLNKPYRRDELAEKLQLILSGSASC